jgi:hypothetical protein
MDRHAAVVGLPLGAAEREAVSLTIAQAEIANRGPHLVYNRPVQQNVLQAKIIK